jgi:predicted MPP superfamily phosphohydrolase
MNIYSSAFAIFLLGSEAGRAVASRTGVLIFLLLLLGIAGYIVAKWTAARLINRLLGVKTRSPQRRWFIMAVVIIAIYIATAAYAFLIEPNSVHVRHLVIKSDKLHINRAFRIAQLSDIHAEAGCEKRMLIAADLIRSAHPDLIVLTGDYANDWEAGTQARLAGFAGTLVSIAPTTAIPGNWDSPNVYNLLNKAGVTVMRNQIGIIKPNRKSRICIIGMENNSSTALSHLLTKNTDAFRVILTHTPDLSSEAAANGIDLYLCGHTHGGQVRLPWYGTICPEYKLVGKYQMGDYKLRKTTMYINPGLGMEGGAPKLRFFCRPEVTLIELQSDFPSNKH